MQGGFFSSYSAPEVIVQKAFAEELMGKTPTRGGEEPNVADLAKPLLGKELTIHYMQRAVSPPSLRRPMPTRRIPLPTPIPIPTTAPSPGPHTLSFPASRRSRLSALPIWTPRACADQRARECFCP